MRRPSPGGGAVAGRGQQAELHRAGVPQCGLECQLRGAIQHVVRQQDWRAGAIAFSGRQPGSREDQNVNKCDPSQGRRELNWLKWEKIIIRNYQKK